MFNLYQIYCKQNIYIKCKQKKYTIINYFRENISYHTSNLIYLLKCSICNIQYVGETVPWLHKRININRTAKSDCEHMINKFWNDCVGPSFSVQILEIFEDNGYVNGTVCSITWEKRIERKSHLMKTLRKKIEIGVRTLINLLLYNFHQLAKVQKELNGLEKHQCLLPIQLIWFLSKST